MCARVHMHVRGHAHLVFYMYVRVCLYICVVVCMPLHVCTRASTCVYMCVYVWCVRVLCGLVVSDSRRPSSETRCLSTFRFKSTYFLVDKGL